MDGHKVSAKPLRGGDWPNLGVGELNLSIRVLSGRALNISNRMSIEALNLQGVPEKIIF